MKKLVTVAIAASALTASVPALAQSYLDDRASGMEQRIDNGVANGTLSVGEASVLRDRLHGVERLQDRYEADGMAPWQRRAIERRYDRLSSQIYNMRHNDEYRYRRWGDIW